MSKKKPLLPKADEQGEETTAAGAPAPVVRGTEAGGAPHDRQQAASTDADPRQETSTIDDPRQAVEQILSAAHSIDDPTSLLAMLAEKAPVALAEVCCGARAPGGPKWVRAALVYAAELEVQLTPRGAWGRLIELAGDAQDPDGASLAALRIASERHPAASWLLKLSRKVEGPQAGFTHLVASAGHPSFAQSCFAHAEAGHLDGLLRAAAVTGRPEPAAALVGFDLVAAAKAAGAALETNAQCSIVAHLAAVSGPEPDLLVAKIIPHLRWRATAEALRAQSTHLPHTTRVLGAVIPGMAR